MGKFKSIQIAAKSILKPKPQQWGTFKCVLINGCDAGSVGASLALILANNSVRVFACSSNGSAMAGLEHHPNITAMVMNANSPSTIDTAPEMVKEWLNGEILNMLINAGSVGTELPSYYTPEETSQRYNGHLLTARRLPLAFKDLLAESHGAIVNLTSAEMLEHERSITSHPSTNGDIMDVTEFLRSTMAPDNIKVVAIVHEPHGPGSGLASDESRSWSNVSALAQDILRDISRLPGYDRAL